MEIGCLATGILAPFVLLKFFPLIIEAVIRLIHSVFSSCAASGYDRFGPWAVVTGSTDGIGEAVAIRLAEAGINLVLISRSQEKLEITKQKISKTAPKISVDTFAFDFASNSSSWTSLQLDKLQAVLDNVEVGLLVNNVGLSYPSALKFDELEANFIHDIISVNIKSVFQMTRMVLPGMRKRRRGFILCIGSGASELPSAPLYCAYSGAKAAVENFCRSLQVECVDDNIVIQCQAPMLVATKMSKMKKSSFFVESPESFALSSLTALKAAVASYWVPTTVTPGFVHRAMLAAIRLAPAGLWSKVQLGQALSVRKKYQMKSKSE